MSIVSVIGVGRLGSKIAYTIAQRGIADDVQRKLKTLVSGSGSFY